VVGNVAFVEAAIKNEEGGNQEGRHYQNKKTDECLFAL